MFSNQINSFLLKKAKKKKKKKKISVTSYTKTDIAENMCDHTVEYWQLSMNVAC